VPSAESEAQHRNGAAAFPSPGLRRTSIQTPGGTRGWQGCYTDIPGFRVAQMRLNHEQIINALGEVEDVTVAQILALGATAEELAEARAWLANDEPLMNIGKKIPTGRVGRLVDLLAKIEEEKLPSDSEP
jgi:hypothetical protein